MVLQVLAHARQIVHHGNPQGLRQRGRAYARQLQQLRRLDGACRQNHFGPRLGLALLPALQVADAGGAPAAQHQLRGHGIGLYAQIGAAPGLAQIGLGRTAAQALVGGELVVACALLVAAVEVLGAGHADLACTGNEGLDQRMLCADVRDLERPVRAMAREGAARIAFGLHKVGQHLLIRPACIAQRRPVVVVLALAAHVDQSIDGAAAAQRAAARPVDAPAVHVGVRVGLELPVVDGAPHGLAVADGQVDPGRAVRRAGLQQQHPRGRVLGQARGQHAAGRACSHDHVVIAVDGVRHAVAPFEFLFKELFVPLSETYSLPPWTATPRKPLPPPGDQA